MQTRFSKQRGITIMGLLFVLVVLAVFGYTGLQLMPFYQENMNIVRSINKMKENDTIKAMSPRAIQAKLIEQFYFNDVKGINAVNFEEFLVVERTSNGRRIVMDYRRDASLFYNVRIMAEFKGEFEL
ncbi:MAG: DUF4845 domain-containing protein [Pseudomonadota bacterium]